MNRSLKLSMMLALALGSTQAAALELGQIRVRSALGQPLLAEIPVNPASPAELQNLSASLASSEAFARAGISSGRPSLPLLFTVADAGGGQKVIRITSSAPVNDPYLDLLVQVNSAAGSSTREYAILLDPPGQGTAAAAVRAPAPGMPARRAVSSERSRRAAAPAPRPAAAAGNGVTVESGQTLSGIARENLPAGASANQMLLALKQANPDAFYRDNINALKAGAVLHMPSREDVLGVDVATARAEVLRQNDDWRSGAARRPVAVADAAARSAGAAPSAPATGADDRLALVPSRSGGAGRTGAAGAHQELLRTQEALNSLQQQSDELKSRLKDLEDINAKNTRLLALKDDEIAELQRKLAEARKAAGLPPAPASTPAASASAAVAGAATAAGTPAPAAAASAASRPAAHPAGPRPAVAPRPAAVAAEPWYTQLWAQVVGAVVVVGLLVLALLGRRRKASAEAAASAPASLSSRFGDMPPPSSGAAADPDADLNELLDQLAEHPDDVALHLELVSLYYGRRDVEHFEAAAEVMYAHIADPAQEEWQEVVRMGEDLAPGHPLFAHAGLHEDAADAHGLDSYLPAGVPSSLAEPAATVPPAPPLPESAQAAKAGDDFHFDAELDKLDYADFMPPEQPLPPLGSGPEKGAEPAEPAKPWSWTFDEPADEPHDAAPAAPESHVAGLGGDSLAAPDAAGLGDFSDDPVDTKLDLARAYLDMGDGEGARAMLEEVLQEGSQMQKDTARKLLDDLPR
jgi:pilus assembly protein FimV